MKAIYARFKEIEIIELTSIEAARISLQNIEDYGEGYAIGIYDEESKVIYVQEENMDICGKAIENVFNEKLDTLKSIGIEPLKIDFY